MTESCRKAFRVIPVLVLCFGAPLFGQSDPTLENAEELLTRAFSQVGDTAVAQTMDAGPVIAALRSSKDKELLPLFERMQKSQVVENQIYGMIAAIVVTKDPQRMDLPLILGAGCDVERIGNCDADRYGSNYDGAVGDGRSRHDRRDAEGDGGGGVRPSARVEGSGASAQFARVGKERGPLLRRGDNSRGRG